jgi:hypothetical protein
MRYPRKDGVR